MDHAAVNTQKQTAKRRHVIAREDRHVAVLLQGRDLIEIVVRHFHTRHVRAGVQDGEQFFSSQPGPRIHGIIVERDFQVRRSIKCLEEFSTMANEFGK